MQALEQATSIPCPLVVSPVTLRKGLITLGLSLPADEIGLVMAPPL